MTRRPHRLAPLALAALSALAGCQDYNFSPVNQCLLQPGTEAVKLSDISTADILFVVDDSGSMGGKQTSLKNSFDAFVTTLTNTNTARVAAQLEPIDFHIAITTTSVFVNNYKVATCRASCAGAGQVCCDGNSNEPLKAPKPCQVDADCTAPGGPFTCQSLALLGAAGKTCADAAKVPVMVPVACPVVGQPCGELQERYLFSYGPRSCGSSVDCRDLYATCRTGCTGAPTGGTYCCDASGAIDPLQCDPGVGSEYAVYPRGDFVKAATSVSGPPPLVIHFDKNLFCTLNPPGTVPPCSGPADPSAATEIQKRIDWFKANVAVGTCGSPQEMGLEAARRALKKALQLDGLTMPGLVAGEWPHAKSKLVTVWVGDEDDCSTPESATAGVIMSAPNATTEACQADGSLPPAEQKRYPLDDFSGFLSSLGRPLATGFIVSATGNSCEDASCQAGLCIDASCLSGPFLCGGQGAGYRFVDLATTFRTKGSDVVVGSICHPGATGPDFSSILNRVAEVVKQPTGLQLPSQPASAALTNLIIMSTDGKTPRLTCSRPAPVGTSGTGLDAYDWWFTDGNDVNSQLPTGASRFIYINRTLHRCEANPGETYWASYLGLLPAGGCATADDCNQAFEKDPANPKHPWACSFEQPPPPGARGTCTCAY